MMIFVKKLQGGECIIDVDGSQMVQDLKVQLEQQLGVPAASQTLVYLGKTLTDDSSVEAAGLKDGCKVHLITRRSDTSKPQTPSKNTSSTSGSSSSSSSNSNVEDVFTILSKILQKHMTPEQSERVLVEFRKNCKLMTDSMNLEDIQRFVDSGFTQF